jgi:succinate-semialdehyde dehydrogenase/glutarate-semialdehyde dehydrogenase
VTFRAVDPYRAVLLSERAANDDAQNERVVAATHEAQRWWRQQPLDRRQAVILEVARVLRDARDGLAEAAAREMGKPITAARAEVDKCVLLCEQAVHMAPRALAPERLAEDALGAWRVEHHPLGVVLAIMPWNFPYWQAMRVIVPNLLAGNTVLHKPASSVAGCASQLHAVLSQAATARHAPSDIASLLFAHTDDLGAIIADERVAGVTLTGSERAGASVAALAGRHLKKVVLELGGSDPFLVLADADVQRAARAAVTSRLVNGGQSCIAAKRFIVCEPVADAFLDAFAQQLRGVRLGDPLDPRTDVGPLASHPARDQLAEQVRTTVAAGARVHAQLRIPEGPGAFFPPTILVDVPDGTPAADDELFGPVAPVFRVPDVSAAIARANATRFGLGASVWTRNPRDAARCVAELEAGLVFVNEVVASDPRAPFGGVKHSGMGRELGTPGFREFTNTKTVRVAE